MFHFYLLCVPEQGIKVSYFPTKYKTAYYYSEIWHINTFTGHKCFPCAFFQISHAWFRAKNQNLKKSQHTDFERLNLCPSWQTFSFPRVPDSSLSTLLCFFKIKMLEVSYIFPIYSQNHINFATSQNNG